MLAITHSIPDNFEFCLNTHIKKRRPDLKTSREQWNCYCQKLKDLGCEVTVLEVNANFPDSPFVEDTGLVLGDHFLSARMKSTSRQTETVAIAEHFRSTHRLLALEPPAYLDGGDVLKVGDHFFVGESGRTNRAAFEQLSTHLKRLGYTASSVSVNGCLHLKTAVTALDKETLLLNPERVEKSQFANYRCLTVQPEESFGANVLRVGSELLVASGYPKRDDTLAKAGFSFQSVDISEIEKAEAGLTCLSLIVPESSKQ